MSSNSFFNHTNISFYSRDMAASSAIIDFNPEHNELGLNFANGSLSVTVDGTGDEISRFQGGDNDSEGFFHWFGSSTSFA